MEVVLSGLNRKSLITLFSKLRKMRASLSKRNMSSASQTPCFLSLPPKSPNGVSSKTNLSISPNLKVHTFKSLRILASSTNSNSPSSESMQNGADTRPSNLGQKDSNPISESMQNGADTRPSNLGQKDSNPISESSETEAKNKKRSDTQDVGGGKKEMPLALRLAMEKAKEYKKKKKEDVGIVSGSSNSDDKKDASGMEKTITKSSTNRRVEKVSSIDFVGLNFSDKKQTRGLPPGLVPMENNFSEQVLSDVEVILGDTSKFGTSPSPELNEQDSSDLYKPKVSTWGVFPRPNDISKTFGGGRTIRPGDVLETAEDKAAKDARTKQLLAAYKNKMGLNIDAKLKSACEMALKDGDNLMDKGKLKEALPFYEKVMKDMAFQNELHGVAALQWSICQDSLSRQNEARVMYEKLQTHPNATVRKKAQQFVFGFQAMEILKVKNSSANVNTTDYRNYFEAFVPDKTSYPRSVSEEEEDDAFQQTVPYILFLLFPIVFVLLIAARRGI